MYLGGRPRIEPPKENAENNQIRSQQRALTKQILAGGEESREADEAIVTYKSQPCGAETCDTVVFATTALLPL